MKPDAFDKLSMRRLLAILEAAAAFSFFRSILLRSLRFAGAPDACGTLGYNHVLERSSTFAGRTNAWAFFFFVLKAFNSFLPST